MNDETKDTSKSASPESVDIAVYDEPSRERLIEVLESLESQIKKQTSLKFAFLKGAIYGLGTVIGATILLAILGGVIASAVTSLSDMPFVGEYFNTADFDSYIPEDQQ